MVTVPPAESLDDVRVVRELFQSYALHGEPPVLSDGAWRQGYILTPRRAL
jgi:hypothetical protein